MGIIDDIVEAAEYDLHEAFMNETKTIEASELGLDEQIGEIRIHQAGIIIPKDKEPFFINSLKDPSKYSYERSLYGYYDRSEFGGYVEYDACGEIEELIDNFFEREAD